jgi:site-specific recombinase XerC
LKWADERHLDLDGFEPVDVAAYIESIDTSTVVGLRDQALIGLMLYSFSRMSAVVGMQVGDVRVQASRTWIRLAGKGGKSHDVPVHRKAGEYLHPTGEVGRRFSPAHGYAPLHHRPTLAATTNPRAPRQRSTHEEKSPNAC